MDYNTVSVIIIVYIRKDVLTEDTPGNVNRSNDPRSDMSDIMNVFDAVIKDSPFILKPSSLQLYNKKNK